MRHQIKYIDAGRMTPNINILEDTGMLVKSWDAVSANTIKNCFRKAGIEDETQVASINDEDDLFKLLEENVNELKSRGLVDGDLTVDDYVNIDFEVCTSENKCYQRSRNSGFHFNQRLCWGRRGDRRRVKQCASRKAKIIRDCTWNRVA